MPVVLQNLGIQQNIITPQELRNRWCFGLPLSKEDGEVMSDEDLQAFIDSAILEVERKLGILIVPRKIVCDLDAVGLQEGVDYNLLEPAYDYRVDEYRRWGFIQLRHRPVISVESVKIVLPNNLQVIEFPKEWIKLYPKAGQIHIVPYAGSPTVMTMGIGNNTLTTLINGNLNYNLPQSIRVSYTAGMQEVPRDIKNVIAKIAAIDVLGIAGDAILAGVASISTSVDGLSESFSTTASATNATYGAHILQYQKEVDAFFDPKSGGARQYYKGFTMTVL